MTGSREDSTDVNRLLWRAQTRRQQQQQQQQQQNPENRQVDHQSERTNNTIVSEDVSEISNSNYDSSVNDLIAPIRESGVRNATTEDDDDGSISVEEEGDDDDDDDDELDETALLLLTRRLRCVFGAITCPIVPLGTVVTVAFLYVLFAAFLLDNTGRYHGPFHKNNKTDDSTASPVLPCSHPLHAYVLASLGLAVYIPYHAKLRSYIFEGRPSRRFDQIFHTIALLYVYAGITLIETCREDILLNEDYKDTITTDHDATETITSASAETTINENRHSNTINSCQATCPVLTDALTVYVVSLEIFTLSLILPLLFLPCIYLWFLRQATANQEAMALLQQRLREDNSDVFGGFGTGGSLRNSTSTPRVPAQEIMDTLQLVKLVRLPNRSTSETDEVVLMSCEDDDDSERSDQAATLSRSAMKDADASQRECCICMSDFYIHNGMTTCNEEDLEAQHSEEIVRTPICGHLFHQQCIASWVGGRWERRRRTSRRSRSSRQEQQSDMTDTSDSHASSTNHQSQQSSTNRRRRSSSGRLARRTTCPLCRAELAEESRSRYGTF